MISIAKNLINALLDGAILERVYNNNDFYFGGKIYIYSFIQNDEICFECKGYDNEESADDDLLNIIKHPNNWKISNHSMNNGYPYPWSK